MASLTTIFSWFQKDDIPTEDQFRQTFSSFRHKEDKVPFADVDGLTTAFQNTVSATGFENFTAELQTTVSGLVKKDASNLLPDNVISWKEALGISNIATVDSSPEADDGNVHTKEQIIALLDLINSKVDGSAEIIEEIRESLLSNDVDLDELQEIVNYIKQNREQIELLQAVVIGNTTDDKITLTGTYPNWGVNLQNHFNDKVYEVVEELSQYNGRYTTTISVDTEIHHNLGTTTFICAAFDTLTGYSLPIKVKRIDQNSATVEFDSQPSNPVEITFRKI